MARFGGGASLATFVAERQRAGSVARTVPTLNLLWFLVSLVGCSQILGLFQGLCRGLLWLGSAALYLPVLCASRALGEQLARLAWHQERSERQVVEAVRVTTDEMHWVDVQFNELH